MPDDTNLTIEETDRPFLIQRLWHAVRLSRRPQLVRGLTQPWHSALLAFLRARKITRVVEARTFFDLTMTLVLPEPVSSSVWRYGFVEEDVCLFLLSVLPRGGRFLDIGAHLGFFALLGAHLVGQHGRVLALEPTPNTYSILQRNAARCSNVETYPCAAFSEERDITLHDYGLEFSAFNSVLGLRPPGRRRPRGRTDVSVRARRADDLLAEKGWEGVDVIKIDAESSEGYILTGVEGTICRSRPAVIIEIGDFEVAGSLGSHQIITWFEDRGYAGYEVEEQRIVHHRRRDRYDYANLLFLARERVGCRIAAASSR